MARCTARAWRMPRVGDAWHLAASRPLSGWPLPGLAGRPLLAGAASSVSASALSASTAVSASTASSSSSPSSSSPSASTAPPRLLPSSRLAMGLSLSSHRPWLRLPWLQPPWSPLPVFQLPPGWYGAAASPRSLTYSARLHRATDSVGSVGSASQAGTGAVAAAAAAAADSLPLAGIRVLDMTRVLAGPYCTQMLGDLGAEVIKIEHPVRGDDTRAWGPPFAAYKPDAGRTGPGESAYFLSANRNKKSLALSFQHAEGVAILHALVARCDILVENYLPGTLAKYGLDYETVRALNPRLIYASVTGYGQTGPYSDRAGYDAMVEAEFGLMHITGSRGGAPVKVGVAVTDLTTGLYTSNSILAALLARARTGRGQHIDASLSDCQTALLSNIASSCLVSNQPDSGRWGTAHPSIVPYQSFRTSDGDILVGGGNDRLFGVLCQGLGRPELAADPRFLTNGDRVAHRAQLEPLIEAVTATRTTREWLAVFEGSGLPYAAINDVQSTLRHPHTVARDMVLDIDHPYCGPLKLIRSPMKLSDTPPVVRLPPPVLGQHTDEILRDHLGYAAPQIKALRAGGVVR